MSSVNRVIQLKKEIETLQNERIVYQDRFDIGMKKLKEEFKCNSIEEGKSLLEKLNSKKDNLSNKIDTKIESLESELRK